jgi:hypothetical protein
MLLFMLHYKTPLSFIHLFYIILSALQFIVVKFKPTPEDDNVYYDVALANWLVQIDDNMIGKLLWPKNNLAAGKLVRSEATADKTWQQFEVEVKRYYGMFYIIVRYSSIKNFIVKYRQLVYPGCNKTHVNF